MDIQPNFYGSNIQFSNLLRLSQVYKSKQQENLN